MGGDKLMSGTDTGLLCAAREMKKRKKGRVDEIRRQREKTTAGIATVIKTKTHKERGVDS